MKEETAVTEMCYAAGSGDLKRLAILAHDSSVSIGARLTFGLIPPPLLFTPSVPPRCLSSSFPALPFLEVSCLQPQR